MMAKLAGLAGLMAGMSHFASKDKKKKDKLSDEEKKLKKEAAKKKFLKKMEKFK